jgi:hypothetical protein
MNPFAHMPQESLLMTLDAVRAHAAMQERLFGTVNDYLKDSLNALEKALADKTAKAE